MMATVHQFAPKQPARQGAASRHQVRTFNPSKHLRGGLNEVQRCLTWLDAHELTPRHVVIDTDLAYPIITIESGPECQQLKENHAAYSFGYAPLQGKRAMIWRADMFGCRVEWSERER